MKAEIIKLTPEIARRLLKENTGNRKMKQSVNFLTNQMLAGEWKENGEPIIIDQNGILKDGQHRLTAVIAANYSYTVPLISEVEPDVMDTIDTGVNRTLGDILELNGFMYSNLCAAIVKAIMKYESNLYDLKSGVTKRNTKNYISNVRGLNYAVANKSDLLKLVKLSYNSIKEHQIVNIFTFTEIGLYLYVIGGFQYQREHIEFIKRLTGVGVIEGTAAYWVFKKLAAAKKDKVSVPGKWKLHAVVKAWNQFVNGDIPINRMLININNPIDKVAKL